MPEEDPYKAWLDDFRREVESLAAHPIEPGEQSGRQAQASFASWWKSEQESILEPEPRFDDAGSASGGTEDQTVSARDLADRLERVVQEKAALESQLARQKEESALLRQRQGSFRGIAAELEAKLSRARESYESTIARLEQQAQLLEAQLQALRQDKDVLDKAFQRLEDRAQTAENESRQARERAAAAEAQLLDLRRRYDEAVGERERLRLAQASVEATVSELRRQASGYQERLVQAKEITDSDVTLLRQELREFLVKVKRLLCEAKGDQS
ncbi:MAG TPA: hypothetical protein DEB40_12030 [Elusimicrobia bacterium]|nr:hypothetical protein [Elusimicrobiota bacterium]HBT62462.1 hypothetical protein [Elusimicrobiota bacterium]